MKIIKLTRHLDDRGWFQEILRESQLIFDIKQISLTKTNHGVIKAFHYHKKQDDVWYLIKGHIWVKIFKLDNPDNVIDIFLSEDDPKILYIPRNYAHGYKVLSIEPCLLLYATNQEYNLKNPDEYRLPYDYNNINWDVKNR